MAGHDRFDTGEPVPKELAAFTRGLGRDITLTGEEAAAALDRIINGEEAYLLGNEIGESRRT